MKFILLNGPPRSGKDAITRELTPYIKFRHMKFASPIKRMVAALLEIQESTLENFKDVRSPVLQLAGTSTAEARDTPRNLLIALSEDLLKPRYGDDFFGRVFWQNAKNSAESLVVASDCGFESEVRRLVWSAGERNCFLLRLHRDGCTFDGDSRSYLPDGICRTWDIANDSTVHNATMKVLRIITQEWQVPLQREPDWVKL